VLNITLGNVKVSHIKLEIKTVDEAADIEVFDVQTSGEVACVNSTLIRELVQCTTAGRKILAQIFKRTLPLYGTYA